MICRGFVIRKAGRCVYNYSMEPYYIIGLGNPGAEYDGTRHNIGRTVVTHMAEKEHLTLRDDTYASSRVGEGNISGVPVVYVLPDTYMNRSGDAVRYFKEKHNLSAARCIVVYDDIDVPLGVLKVTTGRGDGGHNGIKSIIGALESRDFPRVRVGIAPTSFWTGTVKRPPSGGPLEKYVLGSVSVRERTKLEACIPTIEDVIRTIVTRGVVDAMNRYN